LAQNRDQGLIDIAIRDPLSAEHEEIIDEFAGLLVERERLRRADGLPAPLQPRPRVDPRVW
jgi:hypothetical protein